MSTKVFTTVPGLVVVIGPWFDAAGEPHSAQASNDVPAVVPDEVASQFEDEIRGYREVTDPSDASKKVREIFHGGPNTALRVDRDKPAASKVAKASVEEKKQ